MAMFPVFYTSCIKNLFPIVFQNYRSIFGDGTGSGTPLAKDQCSSSQCGLHPLSDARLLGGYMYRRILVVTGDQPGGDAPVEYAIALAVHTGAELSLLTVLIPPLIAGMPDVPYCSPLVLESIVEQGEAVWA